MNTRLTSRTTRCPPHSGISLLEVLISMFVLSIGLLALASMIPVGHFQVQQATHADAAIATARKALREIKVRDMLDSESWIYLKSANNFLLVTGEPFEDADGDGGYDSGETYTDLNGNMAWDPPAFAEMGEMFNDTNGNGRYDAADALNDTNGNSQWDAPAAFVIDPLSVTSNNDTNYNFFPYGTANFTSSPTFPKPWRVSILDLPKFDVAYRDNSIADKVTTAAISQSTADLIFRGSDDKLFEMPEDTTRRPILVNPTSSVQLQSKGDYSWMVMVSPRLRFLFDSSTTPPTPIPRQHLDLGELSIIVFYKRDLAAAPSGTTPSERFVWADVLGGGSGSMDVQLRDTSSPDLDAASNVLNVRVNQWIMLSGQIAYGPSPPPFQRINVHRWFRVTAVGEVQLLDPTTGLNGSNNPWVRDVTLAGPSLDFFDSSGNTLYVDADATGGAAAGGDQTLIGTICDGVVAVFQKTVQLDEPSLWTGH